MENKRRRGGSRIGAGRKKGSGLSSAIKKHVDNFMLELIKDEKIKSQLDSDIFELSNNNGWIYIIKDTEANTIKIGVTQQKNPNKRLSHYSVHKIKFDLLFIDKINECYDVENYIHNFLSEKRVRGDWFNLSNEDVYNIISLINKKKYSSIYGWKKK